MMGPLPSRTFLAACAVCAACAAPCVCAGEGTNLAERLSFDAGGDVRVRQEIMHNVPGLPGAPGAMMPKAYQKNRNHVRFRVRPWLRMDGETAEGAKFGLYARVVDEFREYVVKNGQRRDDRAYNFPDELALDNLYLEGIGLWNGFFDFRAGRQDLFDGKHSVFGLDHILLDGAPYVGSRSCYADMLRTTFHFSEDSKLDAFALYDNGRNDASWGTKESRGRSMNAIHPGDSPDMDEWGGGLVWADALFEKRLPYQLYAIHKHNESYRAPSGAHVPDKQITAFGARVEPQIDKELSLDFEAAQQFGTRSNDAQAGGYMGYGAIDWHPAWWSRLKPYTRFSSYYLSGDKHRSGADDGDKAWDPMWARAPCDSELFQYGTLYGLGYWSNMLYVKQTVGCVFGAHHAASAYSGPMWAAVDDDLGDPDGGSSFKGWLSAVRYDFPILLRPKNARGIERFQAWGHLMAELFNPGDYFESSRPAYFIRWEVTFAF